MESSEEVSVLSPGLAHGSSKVLSPRDNTRINVAGEDFNPDNLPPIPVPRLRSQDVPKKLPSTLSFHRGGVTSARASKSPPSKVPARVTSSPLRTSPLTSVNKVSPSPKRIRVAKVSARDVDKGKSVAVSARNSALVDKNPVTSNRVVVMSTGGRGAVVSQSLPLTPAPISVSNMPVYKEERVVRVIRAAPKGFLNIPNIPDYSVLSQVQQEAMRAKFNMKLEIIRKNKPSLPVFGEEEPLHIIHVKYDQYVRQAHIDKTIVKYKVYLTIIFLIIEAIGCKVFNIPIAGYTSDQLRQFIFYEQFLMEIAERQKEGGGDEWPVEVRIFIFMIFQAVIFIIIKALSGFLPVESTKTIRAQINEFMMPSKGVVVDADGIAEPPSSGFDPTGLLNMVGSFIGGSAAPAKPAADVTKHTLPFDD
ncbi:Hypothetical protein BQ3484_124 [Cedratvirus A11]|uniref:Uncharacterized protein n=1 Tax=Cedratvirus A11 TaxID=1903266 RepID=A0A1M7XU29_9VIRU|nr:Hypothetical protein BQ3484_124 [Cedratvirus A11]SHO33192.1 Hypothetical protein BQ3484_124 [Cedratvirus A11]